jgi:hypothetical protein
MNSFCKIVATSPIPKTLYETLFQPTLAYTPPNFILRTIASFTIDDIATTTRVSVSPSVKQAITDNFVIMSQFNYGGVLAFHSISYRIGQLVATAVQHKIEQSSWSKNNKFWISSAVTLMPLAIIFLAGGSSTEMAIASLVKIAASYILPPLYSNPVKELDLISTARNFKLTSFLGKNALTAIRNLITTTIVIDCFISMLATGKEQLSTNLFGQGNQSIFFKACFDNQDNLTMLIGLGRSRTPFAYFIEECAWMLGKIAVDGVFILLNQLGVVKDLRDPLGNLLQPFFQSSSQKRRPPQAAHFTVQTPEKPQHKKLSAKQLRRQAIAKQEASAARVPVDFQPTTHHLTDNAERKSPKIKVKTRGSSQVEVIEAQERVVLPSTLTIPNYPRKLVALYGQGIESIPNVWGVISYGIRKKEKQSMMPYITGLKAGHVGPSGSHAVMKYLGKSKKTHQPIFSIRPANQEMRLLGELVCGEEAVYDALKSAFGYERALELTNQMKNDREEMSLIDFRFIVSHKQINDFLA